MYVCLGISMYVCTHTHQQAVGSKYIIFCVGVMLLTNAGNALGIMIACIFADLETTLAVAVSACACVCMCACVCVCVRCIYMCVRCIYIYMYMCIVCICTSK